MRPLRQLVPDGCDGLYHVVSRVVDKRLIFGEAEKRRFRELLLAYAGFSGIDVVAWCLMDNHFHLLLRVPARPAGDPEQLTEQEVLRRIALIRKGAKLDHVHRVLGQCVTEESRCKYLGQFRRRMGDLSVFMKALKQHFTQWYNWREGREGTLWEGRFKSVVVEASGDGSLGHAARLVSAYIDLNPLRAGLVEDPKEYRWSGYGRAEAGEAESREGILLAWGRREGVEEVMKQYRVFLFTEGSEERIPEGGLVDRKGKKIRRAGIPVALVRREQMK